MCSAFLGKLFNELPLRQRFLREIRICRLGSSRGFRSGNAAHLGESVAKSLEFSGPFSTGSSRFGT